jgi:predicted glycoside hydrolase/deacetylase ChbG (UPF0249 family)
MSQPIILCADDFAQSPAISEGILDLIEQQRLSATSVMSESPYWPRYAPHLASYSKHIDVGLHVNLTHTFESTHPIQKHPKQNITWWMQHTLIGSIDLKAVEHSLNVQLDRFIEYFGKTPDFIDGHQHVHAFPIIRNMIIKQCKRHHISYVRATDAMTIEYHTPLKQFIVKMMSHGFSEELKKNNLNYPPSFSGMYDLNPNQNYSKKMRHWLRSARPGGLIMCHPGHPSRDSSDPIAPARVSEWNYLKSDAFSDALQEYSCRLHPYAHQA